MADLLSALLQFTFGKADAAAAPTTAVALIPDGAPDAADVAGYGMPKAGAVVGLMVAGAPTQAGDFVTCQVYKNGTAIAGTSVSNAYVAGGQESASAIFSKDTAANQFAAGDIISAKYLTTTAGTYGVNDIVANVIVQLGLSE